MSIFPSKEADILVLASNMVSGYTEHAADFPSVIVADLSAALADYQAKAATQLSAKSAAKAATEAKDSSLGSLVSVMKKDLKLSEVDTESDPVKLGEIGWGATAPRTPLTPPASATALAALNEGPGTLQLQWTKPASGGAVRNYIIQRRDTTTSGSYGAWQTVQFAYDTVGSLVDQPRGVQMEYRVISSNAAGTSDPCNSVGVVL